MCGEIRIPKWKGCASMHKTDTGSCGKEIKANSFGFHVCDEPNCDLQKDCNTITSTEFDGKMCNASYRLIACKPCMRCPQVTPA